MQITRDPNTSKFYIHSYEPGKILINNTYYYKSLIITPSKIIENWAINDLADLTNELLQEATNHNPQILLLGTGATLKFPAHEFLLPAIEKQIGVEVMTTIAACRTYNVLITEGRNVTAALII